jgi:hypothetical protein
MDRMQFGGQSGNPLIQGMTPDYQSVPGRARDFATEQEGDYKLFEQFLNGRGADDQKFPGKTNAMNEKSVRDTERKIPGFGTGFEY